MKRENAIDFYKKGPLRGPGSEGSAPSFYCPPRLRGEGGAVRHQRGPVQRVQKVVVGAFGASFDRTLKPTLAGGENKTTGPNGQSIKRKALLWAGYGPTSTDLHILCRMCTARLFAFSADWLHEAYGSFGSSMSRNLTPPSPEGPRFLCAWSGGTCLRAGLF